MAQVHIMKKYTTWATCLQAIVDALVAAGWELHYDFRAQTPATIANSTAYSLGQMVFSRLAANNGMIYVCTVAGTSAATAATAFGGGMMASTVTGTATFFGLSRQSVVMRTRQSSAHPWMYCYIGDVSLTNAYATGATTFIFTGFDLATLHLFFGRQYGWANITSPRVLYQAAGTYYTDIFADQYSFYVQLADTANPSSTLRSIQAFLPEVDFFCDMTTITAPAAAGSNVTLQVADSSKFIPNKWYRYLLPDGKYREKVQVTSVPDSTSVIIATLRNAVVAGTYLGSFPFLGLSQRNDIGSLDNHHIWDNGTNTDINTATDAASIVNNLVYPARLSGVGNIASNYYNSQSAITRALMYINTPIVPLGILSDMYAYLDIGTCGDQFGVGEFYRGSVGSATTTTITDSNANWTVNGLVGKRVVLTSGTGAGQSRKIISNTATQITIDSNCPWETLPVSGTSYSLVVTSYRKCRSAGISNTVAIKENN